MAGVVRVDFRVGRRTFPTLDEALAAALAGEVIYRYHYSRRGIRHIEKRTPGGNWQRVDAPGGR